MLGSRWLLARIGLLVLLATCVLSEGCAKPRLRFVNASVRSPGLDVYVSGESAPLFSNVRYRESTPYKKVTVGFHKIEVRPAGTPYTYPPVFVGKDVEYDPSLRYTAVAAGLLETTNPESRLRVLEYTELFGIKSQDNARARFVNAVPDGPAVDVRLAPDDAHLVDDLRRFDGSGAGGELLPADRELMLNFITAHSHETVVTFRTGPLPAETNWFAILTGLANEPAGSPYALTLLLVGPAGTYPPYPPPVTAVVSPVVPVVPAPPPPVVYLLNGSADAPASLDVYLGVTPVAINLPFGGLSGPIQSGGGVQSFDLFGHTNVAGRPAGPPLATLRTTDLQPGQQYLAVIAGDLTPRSDEQPIQLVICPGAFPAGQAPALRLLNALVGSPPLQAGVIQNGAFLTPVPITAVAFAGGCGVPGAAFPVGPVQLGLSPVGAAAPVAMFVVEVSPGMQAFVVPIGAMSPAAGERPIRLAVIYPTVSPWTVTILEPR